ncbi:MAG: CPBP family intramembrane metalloprotease [Caldilineaceae bacterium]|nr:CPBP family intramembrane metalloprotease [Caldilineaceae bacterium]
MGLGLLSGLSDAQLGWVWVNPGWQIVEGCSRGLLLAAIFYSVTRQLTRRTGQRFYSSVILEAIVPRNRREMLLVSLAMIPVVLLEELLFRSLLLGGMAPILPTYLLIVSGGVLFGWMHSPQGLWGDGRGWGCRHLLRGAIF